MVADHYAGWRGWHVIIRFIPMIFLGILFVAIGLAHPVIDHVSLGEVFLLVGAVLIVFAIIGILFTKCPLCYRHAWIMCTLEPDVRHDRQFDDFYRELTPLEDDG